MNSQIPSVLTRSRRRLVIFLLAIAVTALALALILSGTTARGASIYAAVPSLGVIERYDAITGADLGAFATHLSIPGGMVFDRAGNLYVNEKGSATIRKIAPDGTATVFYSGGELKGSNALAIDANGTIYVATYSGIRRITTAGFSSIFAAGGDYTNRAAMAFDSGGNLFVTNGDKAGSVSKITPTGLLSIFYRGPASPNPMGIAIDRDDTLLVADYSNRTLNRISPGGILSMVATHDAFYQTTSLVLGGGGDIIFSRNQSSTISRRSSTGTVTVFALGNAPITALALGPNPVPEPSVLTLSITGLAGFFLKTRHGRQTIVA